MFIAGVLAAFRQSEAAICSEELQQGLTSAAVLQVLRPQLETLGFQVEAGKNRQSSMRRSCHVRLTKQAAIQTADSPRVCDCAEMAHARWHM